MQHNRWNYISDKPFTLKSLNYVLPHENKKWFNDSRFSGHWQFDKLKTQYNQQNLHWVTVAPHWNTLSELSSIGEQTDGQTYGETK